MQLNETLLRINESAALAGDGSAYMPMFKNMDCKDADLVGETFRIGMGPIDVKPKLISTGENLFG